MIKDKMVMDAILLQCKGEIKQYGDTNSSMGFIYEVEGHTVRIFKKPGRRMITCTCESGTRFCNSSTICKHKLSAIMQWIKLNGNN